MTSEARMPSATKSDAASNSFSFRDPAGRLIRRGDHLVRAVYSTGLANLQAFQKSATVQRLSVAGQFISAEVVAAAEAAHLRHEFALPEEAVLLRHERIDFPSYAYEWPAEMLAAAAELTLDLAEGLLEEGLGLKDATPFNVLFRGPEPVFVDVLSIEPRDGGDPVWRPYAQFVRTFLLPLLAYRHFRLSPDQVFTGRREGLSPEDVYRMSGPVRRVLPPILGYATIPTWLNARSEQKGTELYQARHTDPHKARFVLASRLRKLRKSVRSTSDFTPSSHWTDYAESHPSYTPQQEAAKKDLIRRWLAAERPAMVLDIGCNTGDYSLEAVSAGARVVAIDADAAVVGQLYRRAAAKRSPVLPLVVNLAQPSPATGWQNDECPSFLDRARGHFDAVMMLAVLHHLMVSERVPLEAVLDLAAELTRDWLLIEFIAPQDAMFRRIVHGREELHAGLDRACFEEAASRRFRLVGSQTLPQSARTLYLLRRGA